MADDGARNCELLRACAELRGSSDLAVLASSHHVTYVSGFEPAVPLGAAAAFAGGPAVVVLAPGAGTAILLVQDVDAARAGGSSRLADTRSVPSFGHFEPVDALGTFLAAVVDAACELAPGPLSSIAVEPATLPSGLADGLRAAFPDAELVDASAPLGRARRIKTSREIALIRRAVRLADLAQTTLLERVRSGASELELWHEVTGALDAEAGRPVPVSGELVSGPRTGVVSYPSGPITRVIERGDTVLMDISPRLDGYWGDCCNTLVADAPPTDVQRRFFEGALAAHEAAVGALRPGARASDVDRAARAAFAEHGLPVAHYTGHQIGLTVNELPRLLAYDHDEIAPGMVFCIEPGAYAGTGGTTGARCERTYLVTEEGSEGLSHFSWGMQA